MRKLRKLGTKRWWKRVNAPLHAAWITTVLCTMIFAGHVRGNLTIPGLDDLELAFIDARFRIRGTRAPASADIVIVGLDDETRKRTPEIFQARRGWAKLIRELARHKPLAVGIDAFFASPELAVDPDVVKQVKDAYLALRSQTDPPRTPAADQALAALEAVVAQTRGDDELAEAIAAVSNVYLGIVFGIANKDDPPAPPGTAEEPGAKLAKYAESAVLDQPASRSPPRASWVAPSLPKFTRGAVGAGALNVKTDRDGKVRRIYGVIDHAGRYYMPLGMTMAVARLGPGHDTSYVTGDQHLTVGKTRVPTGKRGELMLNHLGPSKKTFTYVSAADVLEGKPEVQQKIAGRLVFVGFTDAARDKVVTPYDTNLDGVELHATLAHNILHKELMSRASPLATLVTIALMGCLLLPFQLRRVRQRRPWIVPTAGAVIALGYLGAAQILFSGGLIIDLAVPVAATLAVTLVAISAVAITEGRERAQLRSMFSQYVGGSLMEEILNDPEQAALGGNRRDLTVLFSDIRGFSEFSEQLEPEVLSSFLNEYLTPMTEILMARDGMLDKYIGDAVMAVFGAPPPRDDHANRACATALEMLEALGPLNRDFAAKGLPRIAIGIGINSGPMSVGNMGSATRTNYTVMGDAVNLGARLEGLTKTYRVDVLCGENTATMAEDEYVFRELDLVRVKGRGGTARIYTLVGKRGKVSVNETELAVFASALEAYRNGEWDKAVQGFEHFLKRYPDDGPSKVMLERLDDLRASPPSAEWDGVFEARFK